MLKLPLSDAEALLDTRIAAGRELVDTGVAGLDARLATVPYARHMYGPGVKSQGEQEVDALSRRVSQWRDYNRTWLGRNLGGEAAEEYEEASTHWGSGGADDPRVNLRFLGENVEREISKLESIRERLPMWLPSGATAPTSAVTGSRADGGGPIMFATNRKLVMVIRKSLL